MDPAIPARPDHVEDRSVTLSFTLSTADVARAQRRGYRLRPMWTLVPLALWGVLILLSPSWDDIVFLVLLVVLLVVVMPFVIAALQRNMRDEIRLSLDDATIVIATPKTTTSVQWGAYLRLEEDRDAFYLVERRRMCLFMIPKRSFRGAADELAFRALCAGHLGRA